LHKVSTGHIVSQEIGGLFMSDVHFDLGQTTNYDMIREVCAMQGAVIVVVSMLKRDGFISSKEGVLQVLSEVKKQLQSK
jgi:hypothetical protein